jgi:serine/threonine protein kinase
VTPERIGKYQVVRRLGQGGCADVYEANDPAISKRVAIKVLKPKYASDAEMAKRFISEARAVNVVEHPGIVAIHDHAYGADGAPFIVMEYLDGETLDSLLGRHPVPLEMALDYTTQIARALAAAHEKGIIHRDLKPGNVMVARYAGRPHDSSARQIKVLDFGLAKLAKEHLEAGINDVDTEVGAVLGTRWYSAPEQLRDSGDVTEAVDVYALGRTLADLLAGRRLHADDIETLKEFAPPIAALIRQMRHYEPEARPSMNQVVARISTYQMGPVPAAGAIGRALRVGLPTLVDWNESFENGYTAHSPKADYREYMRALRNEPHNSDDKHLELIINRCVEGDTVEALRELEALDDSKWLARNRTAYHRLRGTLLRELGDTAGAEEAYTDALRAWGKDGDEVAAAIGWDLLNIRQSKDQSAEWERLRKLDVWPGNTAYEYARVSSGDAFARERFSDVVRPEGSIRLRNGMADEISWHNTALAVAYLTGSYSDARQARVAFAKHVVAAALPARDVHLLTMAAFELIAARDDSGLKELLGRAGHLVHELLKLDEVVLALRPRKDGACAEKIWATILVIIRAQANFFNEETRSRITDEMLDAAWDARSGRPRQFLEYHSERGGFRAPSYFIDALAQVSNLSTAQLSRLLDMIEASKEEPVKHWSLWEVVVEHTWNPNQIAEAERALGLLLRWPISGDSEDHIIGICWDIGTQFPELREIIAHAFLSTDDLGADDKWRIFLSAHYPQAATKALAWAEDIVADETKDLLGTAPKDGYRVTGWTRSKLLAPLFKTYPEAFPNELRVELLTRVLSASSNPHIYVVRKASVLEAIAGAVRVDPAMIYEPLNSVAASRTPSSELSRAPSRANDEPGAALAQLRLLDVWIALAIPCAGTEFVLLSSGIADPKPEVRRTALCVAGAAVKANLWRSELLLALFSALQDSDYSIRATAAFAWLTSNSLDSDPLATAIFERLFTMARTDHPSVVRTILFWLGEDPGNPAP